MDRERSLVGRSLAMRLGLGLLLAGLVGGVSASLARPRQAVIVTRDDQSLPTRCRPGPTARVVLDFFKALADGDERKLDGIFDTKFKWFSVTDSPVPGHKRHFVAYEPQAAIEYITERRGFDLLLSNLVVDDKPSPRHNDIYYNGVWRQDGARILFAGKGAINCRKETIKVWSMAARKQEVERGPAMCPAPASDPEANTVIACVRET